MQQPAIKRFFNVHVQEQVRQVDLLSVMGGLRQEQRSLLIAAATTARGKILLGLHIKYGEWSQLPHILCSLGNSNLALARHYMKKAVALWDARDTRRYQHALADLLLNPHHPKGLRLAVDSFIAGGDMPPVLRPYAGGLAAIRTTERSIEGQMSRIKSVFQHSGSSGPHTMNHVIRCPEVTDRLMTTPHVNGNRYRYIIKCGRNIT